MTELVSRSHDQPAGRTFPWIAEGMAFGGDYSPEQWAEEVWVEDVALMQRAGVNSVNLGVFSWGLLEVADGVFEWGWLDRILDLLHEGGIGVNLSTPTAAPPIWLLQTHPEIATVDENGVRTGQGGRLAWSPSSATFRRYALRMVRALAERYRDHPALRLWHVSNEIGNENSRCYSDETAVAWRAWLEAKYTTVDAVNDSWGSAFWGHHYTSFTQIEPPRFARASHNPGLLLDFDRFSSDALLGHYLAEREVLREVTPDIPVTTNFMIMSFTQVDDYGRWAEEVDVVANDHYTISSDPLRHSELSFSADRTRGIAKGDPWLLIEHSTSAVNWQTVNRAKEPGELTRNSLAHIARGADGALFFQWRMSTAGAEQFHSGIVTHAGADSKVFREVEALGAALKNLAPVVGSRVESARVAILFDHDSASAQSFGRMPSTLLTPQDLPKRLHRAFAARHIAVDVVPSTVDLSGYSLVVVPTLYLVSDEAAERIAEFARGGGHVVVSYFSGIVDESSRVREGGYPGAFRDLLQIRTDEFFPLFEDESVELDNGWTADLWTESLELRGATALASYRSGERQGVPALTRASVGTGTATYLASRPDDDAMLQFVDELAELASLPVIADADAGLELVRRVGADASFLFALNHTAGTLTVREGGTDLITGEEHGSTVTVPAGGAVVVMR
ncbi:beta-galactosidase [Marisediminicola sp. LYQ85]|uniref:beta-galactosidase n=1 Tax=Marisediminicola sp. LYQ85 TaxID=3391062 RepID=UPI0039836589